MEPVDDKYELLEIIYRGPLNCVYRARNRVTGALCAIKRLEPTSLPISSLDDARFKREIAMTVALQLRSRHIVRLFDGGIDKRQRPWLAMEYLQGETLTQHVMRSGALQLAAVQEILGQVCHGLLAAHTSPSPEPDGPPGIIHRDLKPDNVFLEDSTPFSVPPRWVRLLDFGIACWEDTRHNVTKRGAPWVGTPLWMAPEQYHRAGARRPAITTDVWAVGLIAFWMLTGHHYLWAARRPGCSDEELAAEITESPLPLASVRAARLDQELGTQTASLLPPGFDAWFAGCVVREPERRYTDARRMLRALLDLNPTRSIDVRRLAAGSFRIGSPPDEVGRWSNEEQTQVTIAHDLDMAVTAVTQQLYSTVMRANPSTMTAGAELPVENLSFYDAVSFCNELSQQCGLTPCYQVTPFGVRWSRQADGYRLPTEAEWEYGARGGQYHRFAGSDDVRRVAWYADNSEGRTQPVARKDPNAWGLFDMSGNVFEWVWHGEPNDPGNGSADSADDARYAPMVRGGSWANPEATQRVAHRIDFPPDTRSPMIGLRICRTRDSAHGPRSGATAGPAGFESILRNNPYLNLNRWLDRLNTLRRQICMIELPAERGVTFFGTGFLVGPSAVLTNFHVLAALRRPRDRVDPAQVRVHFDYWADAVGEPRVRPVEFRLARERWEIDASEPGEESENGAPTWSGYPASVPDPEHLDYTLLRVDGEPGNQLLRDGTTDIAQDGQRRGWIEIPQTPYGFPPNSPLIIMQHAEARPLSIAIDTNSIHQVNANGTRVRYRTSTAHGSSGSPCFTIHLELVALHHYGDPGHKPTYNQGIPISAIRALIEKRGHREFLGP